MCVIMYLYISSNFILYIINIEIVFGHIIVIQDDIVCFVFFSFLLVYKYILVKHFILGNDYLFYFVGVIITLLKIFKFSHLSLFVSFN